MGYIEVVHEPLHKAPVPAEPPNTFLQMLLGINGRIGRKEFAIYGLVSMLVFGVTGLLFYGFGMSGDLERSSLALPLSLLGLLWCLGGAWVIFFALPIKRLHDANRTGFWVILNFFGVLFLPLFAYLLLIEASIIHDITKA